MQYSAAHANAVNTKPPVNGTSHQVQQQSTTSSTTSTSSSTAPTTTTSSNNTDITTMETDNLKRKMVHRQQQPLHLHLQI